MRRYRHAKIVATIGPASSSPEKLRELFIAGVDTFRLNFSHGSHDDHARVHHAIRALERDIGRPIGILQDLQGPKIRIGRVDSGRRALSAGDRVRFTLAATADGQAIPLPHPEIFSAILPGQTLLIDDGRLRLQVTECDKDRLEAEVIVGGVVSDRKGVNLPGTLLALSPLTTKDRADLEFGLELGVDWVALSFVQRPSDVLEARGLVGDRAGLIVKVEKPAALEQIDEIINLADAIMVARGDLGVEIPPEDVPGRQKEMVQACRRAGKPVIVATQMLDSMVNAPTPTRAEASDVATAIYDGTDAVMLSAESATGQYPAETVAMMNRIVARTEQHKLYRPFIAASEPALEATASHSVATAAARLANEISASAIVAFSARGTTAARIARNRPDVAILVVTPDERVSRRMCLFWGVHTVRSEEISSYEEMVHRAGFHAISEGFAKPHDLIVVVSGVPFGIAGTTNNLRVLEIGSAHEAANQVALQA